MPATPLIEITYCRLCGWGLRAGWMAQELLTTFAEEAGSVALTPDASGGVFEVRVGNETVWSRKDMGRFPELKELKQLVRDRIAPGPLPWSFRQALAPATRVVLPGPCPLLSAPAQRQPQRRIAKEAFFLGRT